MNTNRKGNIGEMAVALAAAEKHYVVSLTFGDCPYDMIIDKQNVRYRVQVKYITMRNGTVTVRFNEKTSNTAKYTEDDVDVIAVYESTTKAILWIPITRAREAGTLTVRFNIPKNGQKKGITIADEFTDW